MGLPLTRSDVSLPCAQSTQGPKGLNWFVPDVRLPIREYFAVFSRNKQTYAGSAVGAFRDSEQLW